MLRGFIKFAIIFVIAAAVVAALSRFFFIDIAEIGHNGMAPTLVAGDLAAIARHADIDIGDVVVCENPIRRGEFVTGRVIAKAGSVVKTDRLGQLNVNDNSIYVDWRGAIRFYDSVNRRRLDMKLGVARVGDSEYQVFLEKKRAFAIRPTEVRNGVFLLGDNRTPHSYDSRHFGEIDPRRCVGQVFMLIKPAISREAEIQRKKLSKI
ncbi:MAG: signal peptidase I [Deltaproteobacteria bacterium]|nr:signal peptidase I [Deltaproteobacteria bacterium]